jgi:hypothetical protein
MWLRKLKGNIKLQDQYIYVFLYSYWDLISRIIIEWLWTREGVIWAFGIESWCILEASTSWGLGRRERAICDTSEGLAL